MPAPQPADDDGLSGRVVTLPNAISLARLAFLLPLSMWLLLTEHWWWGLVALVVLGWTDWLDGFLARRMHQRSVLGARLDPVADRISVVGVCVVLAIRGVVPWWALIAIAVVDVVLLVLSAVIFRGSPDLPVTQVGKWRTAALFLALPVLIAAAATGVEWVRIAGLVLLTLGVIGHVVAGAGYALAMVRRVSA